MRDVCAVWQLTLWEAVLGWNEVCSGELMVMLFCGRNLNELVEDQDMEECLEQLVLDLLRGDSTFDSSDSTEFVFSAMFLKSS